MVSQLINDLGADLYNEIIEMVVNKKNKAAFLSFEDSKLEKAKSVFNKYKDTSVSVQLLYIFLSDYSKYTESPRIFPKENNLLDVTKSFGYTQLVASKYFNNPVI